MSALERKRKIFERQRVLTAKMEMELKIEERLDEIERLKQNIDNQQARIDELDQELGEDHG